MIGPVHAITGLGITGRMHRTDYAGGTIADYREVK
jgi:hypothetical protein